MTYRNTLWAASLCLLAACGDGGTGASGDAGSVRFSYSGGESGSFSASGPGVDPALESPASGKEIATGLRTSNPSAPLQVLAVDPEGSGRAAVGDVVTLSFPATSGAATYRISPACLTENCPLVGIFFGVGIDEGTIDTGPEGTLWIMESGSIRVTSVSDDRVRGTFSGTAISFDDFTGDDFREMEVRGGEFDVPVFEVRSTQAGFARSPALARVAAARTRLGASR